MFLVDSVKPSVLLVSCFFMTASSYPGVMAQEADDGIVFLRAYGIVNVAALVDAYKNGIDFDTIVTLLGKPEQGNEFEIRRAVEEQLEFIKSEAQVAKNLGVVIDYSHNKNNPMISEFDFENNSFYVCFPVFYRSAVIDDWGLPATWKVSGVQELLPDGTPEDFGCPYAVDQEGVSGPSGNSRISTLAIPIRFEDLGVAEHFSKLRESNSFFSTTYCVPDWNNPKTEIRRFEIQCAATKIELTYVGMDGSWNKVLEYTRQSGSWNGELDQDMILSLD